MNYDEIEADGKVFVAKEYEGCDGCAFDGDEVISRWCGAVSCHPSERSDRRSVIFVEKQQ